MIQAAQNNLFIKVAHPYIGNITDILRVSAIANGSSVDSSDIVNIVGEIVSIPKSITTERRGYAGFSTKDIQVGDTAIFRFDVIHEFKMLSKTERTYKNRIWYNGEELWSCDIQKVFGVIRDEKIIMINGYMMIKDFEAPKIFLSQSNARERSLQNSEIMHIGSPQEGENRIEAEMGENVFYNPNLAAKYQINGKPFRVIQQNKVFGKEI